MLVLPLNLLVLPLVALAGTPTIGDEPTRTLAVRQDGPQTSTPCEIVNANGAVNCRAGPHLGSAVVTTLDAGEYYDFNCYSFGDCYEDNWFVSYTQLISEICLMYHFILVHGTTPAMKTVM